MPDEDDSYAVLGAQLVAVRVRPEFKFNLLSASAWIDDEFRKPGE